MDRDTTINPVIARRTALVAGLGGAGALALAACGSSGTSSSAPPADTGTSPDSGSDSSAIAALASIKVGGSIDGTLNGKPILVSRPSANTVACFSAICTHMGCTVQADGAQFRCPCHGSVYSAKTGAVLQGPAPRPLPKIPVQVKKGEIVPG